MNSCCFNDLKCYPLTQKDNGLPCPKKTSATLKCTVWHMIICSDPACSRKLDPQGIATKLSTLIDKATGIKTHDNRGVCEYINCLTQKILDKYKCENPLMPTILSQKTLTCQENFSLYYTLQSFELSFRFICINRV